MVRAARDANDPQPQRDDARFQGDYKAFRKADKAWNERERGRRTRLPRALPGPLSPAGGILVVPGAPQPRRVYERGLPFERTRAPALTAGS